MAKTFRKPTPGVLDLVEESPGPTGDIPGPRPVARSLEPFEVFYRREYPRLLVLSRALAGASAAEDVAQETMLVAYRRWSHIALLDSPTGYVRGICLHKSRSVTRRLIVERKALLRYAVLPPSARCDALEPDSERYWAEVRRLPRRQAQAIVLYYALDLPVADIASTLGCAEGTVKVHLSRARATLAARMGHTEESS